MGYIIPVRQETLQGGYVPKERRIRMAKEWRSSMAKKPGIHELVCRNCRKTVEIEAGIRKLYCCGQLMEEFEEDMETGELRLADGTLIRRKYSDSD